MAAPGASHLGIFDWIKPKLDTVLNLFPGTFYDPVSVNSFSPPKQLLKFSAVAAGLLDVRRRRRAAGGDGVCDSCWGAAAAARS